MIHYESIILIVPVYYSDIDTLFAFFIYKMPREIDII